MIKREQRKAVFAAKVSEMAEADVLRHVGEDRVKAIREADAHPMFIGLNVGYEGVSTGSIEGTGDRLKRWAGNMIRKLAGRMNTDAPQIYEGHQKGTDKRKDLGDVLSGFLEMDGNNTPTAYAVAYVGPHEAERKRIRDGELDVCSVEAACLFSVDADDMWHVEDVEAVEGIALANSKIQRPGFERAGVVAVIQELESRKVEEMTPDEVKAEVKRAGLLTLFSAAEVAAMITQHPSEIFGADRVEKDPVVQGVRERAAAEEIEKRVKAEGRADAAEKRSAELQVSANAGAAGKLVAEALAGDAHKALTDAERATITATLATRTFEGDDAEALTANVAAAIAGEVKTLGEYRKLYGGTEEGAGPEIDGAPAEGTGGGKPGTGFLASNSLTDKGEIKPPE